MIKRLLSRTRANLGPASLFFAFDVLIFYPLLCLLPYGLAFPITRRRGDLHFRIMKGLRTKILDDLATYLPELTEPERVSVARGVFRTQATFFYDTYIWTRYRIRTWMEKFVVWEGLEHLEASHARGSGVIMSSMHFNHYFYIGGFSSALGYKATPFGIWPVDLKKVNYFVKLHHRYIYWIAKVRSKASAIFATRHEKGEIERCLRDNHLLFVLLDVPLPEKQDLRPVTFFGQTCMFPCALIHLTYKTKAPIHFCYTIRDPDDWRKQTCVVSPELTLSGDVDADLQLLAREMEKGIRRAPHLWWGWGFFSRLFPDYIQDAKSRGDYTTIVAQRSAEKELNQS